MTGSQYIREACLSKLYDVFTVITGQFVSEILAPSYLRSQFLSALLACIFPLAIPVLIFKNIFPLLVYVFYKLLTMNFVSLFLHCFISYFSQQYGKYSANKCRPSVSCHLTHCSRSCVFQCPMVDSLASLLLLFNLLN